MRKIYVSLSDGPMKHDSITWHLICNGVHDAVKHFHDAAGSTEPLLWFEGTGTPREVLLTACLREGNGEELLMAIQEVLKGNNPDVHTTVSVRSQDINNVMVVTDEKIQPWLKFIGAEK